MSASALPRRTLVASLAAILAAPPLRANAQAATHLTVLTSPSDSGGEVYYAQELGTFKKHGLDAEIVSLNAGAAVATAIASGKYDIGQGNVVTIAAAREKGLPFVLIAPASIFNTKAPTTALVARDPAIQTAADLAGKPVGNTSLHDIGNMAIDVWLNKNNVAPSSVRIVEMPGAQMSEALLRGTVAAAHIIEPFLSASLAAGNRILAVPYDSIAPRFLIAGFFSTTDWIRAHPNETRAFKAVMAETSRWANANRARSAQILEKYTSIHVSPTQTRTEYGETLDPALIQPLLDAASKDNFLRPSFSAKTLLS